MLAGLMSRWTTPFSCAAFRPSADLDGDVEHFDEGQGAFGDPLLQASAFDEGHGQEHLPLGFVDLVDRADVGVVEDGGGLGLSQESLFGFRVPADLLGQELERDRPAQFRVLGLENDAHPALADDIQELVPAPDETSGLMTVRGRGHGPGRG